MATRKKQNKVSLKQISELAGVTQSTASRILNRNTEYKYAEDTVRKVKEVAKERGYRTSQLYRSVFTGQTKSAGLITASGGFYSEINRGVHDRLLQDGYATIIGINAFNYDDPSDSIEEKIIHRLNEHRVDGFIMRPTLDNATDEHFREIIAMKVPLITLDRQVQSEYADFVGSDDVAGGKLAANYLADMGHKNIVQFAADQRISSFRNRTMGFETGMLERGCNIQTVFYDRKEGITQKCQLLFNRKDRPTAIFCSSDMLATTVYKELEKLNLKVPQDISVMGYGNEHMGPFLNPKLSTINQNPYQIGLAAAELFLERLEKPAETKHQQKTVLVDVELLERDSCRKI